MRLLKLCVRDVLTKVASSLPSPVTAGNTRCAGKLGFSLHGSELRSVRPLFLFHLAKDGSQRADLNSDSKY